MSSTNDDMDDDDADLLAAVESAENPPPVLARAASTDGFLTAGGKTVTVSDLSLAMARRLWSSMAEDEMPAPEAHLKQMTELKRVGTDRVFHYVRHLTTLRVQLLEAVAISQWVKLYPLRYRSSF